MFNLPYLNRDNLLQWLQMFETQVADKLSAISRKIENTDPVKKDIDELREELDALPEKVTDMFYPVGSVIMVYEEEITQEEIESQYGGTWEVCYYISGVGPDGDGEGYINFYKKTK